MRYRGIAAAILAAGLTFGLSGPSAADHHGKAIKAALADEARSAENRALDSARKPDQVLAFLGAGPGMTVLDANAGSGYYTELLSRVVGPGGKVIAFNDDIYGPFADERLTKRVDGRLDNVERVTSPNETLDLPADSVDRAIMVLAYHDYYFTPDNRPEPVDVATALARIKAALKPGAAFVIIDHAAAAGSGPETGNSTHRIDPALVMQQMTSAGFAFDGESDVLRSAEDDYAKNVFDPAVRRKTDRFIYRFKKPS